MFIELVKSAALLLALCFLYGLNVRLLRYRPILRKITTGTLFGSICIIGMHMPVAVEPGIFFDARSVILSMAGLFGGPLVACIAASMAGLTRLWLGGVGVGAGLMVIALSVILGLLYREGRERGRLSVKPLALGFFGLVVHSLSLLLFLLLPSGSARIVYENIAIPFLLVFTMSTMALGMLLRDVEDRLTTDEILRGTAARLQAIAYALPDALLVIDERGQYAEILSSDQNKIFISRSRLIGKNLAEVLPASHASWFMECIHDTLKNGVMHTIEYELETRLGSRYFEGRINTLGIEVGGFPAVVFLARDITERKRAENALHESEIRFRSVLRNIPSVSVQGYQADGTTTYWNKASEELYGYTSEEAMGSNILDLIIPAGLRDVVRKDMRHMFDSGEVIPSGELQLKRKDGSIIDVFSSHAFVEVAGQPPEMFCIDIDISGRKAAEEEARYLAFYDSLTQLPNRRLLVDRLQQVLANGAYSGLTTAVLFVDLDNFKTLNDTRGHEVGDLLLQQVAARLRNSLREQDTVARLGGDEFVVVLQHLSSNAAEAAAQARAVGEKILNQLRQPSPLAGREYHFSASIGVSLLCSPPESVDEVLKQADMAMYQAKDAGRNTLRFFDPEMQHEMNRRATMETELHAGLKNDEFILFYQPQVDSIGSITGAEALVRWNHPTNGMVPPSEFIPLAEESGLILPLGYWVMESAMGQQACWRENPILGQINLAINVSARQFLHDEFVNHTLDILRRTGANPSKIKLELTESFLLPSIDSAISTMLALRAHGIEFSLDDFGTGYSSLNYLKRLPLSQIKIDQGFVRGVLQYQRDAAIARSILDLANNLGLHVIAEGVETMEHYRFLKEHGCSAFQGYLFGKPMKLSDFEKKYS